MYADADDNTSWKVIEDGKGFMSYIKSDNHSLKQLWNMISYVRKTIDTKKAADQYSGDDFENKSKALNTVIDSLKKKAQKFNIKLEDISSDINIKSPDWFKSNC